MRFATLAPLPALALLAALALPPTAAAQEPAPADAELRAVRTALVRGGHRRPDDATVALGARLVARGYTPAQLETVAHESRDGRRLLAAFDALASLQARGVVADSALARVEARLARRDAAASLVALMKQ